MVVRGCCCNAAIDLKACFTPHSTFEYGCESVFEETWLAASDRKYFHNHPLRTPKRNKTFIINWSIMQYAVSCPHGHIKDD